MIQLCKSVMRLEYCMCFCHIKKKKKSIELEKDQEKATRMLKSMRWLADCEQLSKLVRRDDWELGRQI